MRFLAGKQAIDHKLGILIKRRNPFFSSFKSYKT